LRIIALVHRHLVPPARVEEGTDITSAPWRTEYDVVSTLTAMGHEVQTLPVHDDLGEIRRLAGEWRPNIAFNLLEGFDDITIFDQNVISYLELLKLAYTGCNPRGLLLSSLPAWMARLNIRFNTVSSRLISPADTGRLGTSVRGPSCSPLLSRFCRSGVASASRFVTYARNSVVVIVIIRRLPKNGDRWFLIRRLTSS
jgi:hypothetical protein